MWGAGSLALMVSAAGCYYRVSPRSTASQSCPAAAHRRSNPKTHSERQPAHSETKSRQRRANQTSPLAQGRQERDSLTPAETAKYEKQQRTITRRSPRPQSKWWHDDGQRKEADHPEQKQASQLYRKKNKWRDAIH